MTKHTITVVGPTYLDHTIRVDGILSLDGSRQIIEEYKTAGGTGLCYGMALSRQGNNTILFSALGKDEAAKIIRTSVNEEEGLQAIWQTNTASSDYAILFVDDGNHKCVASRKETSDTWRPNENFLQQAIHSDALVITSFANSIVVQILQQLAKIGSNKPFVVWAPHFGNCANARVLATVLSVVDHITLSQQEYKRLNKDIGDPTAFGVKSITVTSGKQGVQLIYKGRTKKFEQMVRIEKPLDTNGAGEAFGAGFLTAFLQTNNYDHAVVSGTFVGALHTERRGSDFPRIRLAEQILS